MDQNGQKPEINEAGQPEAVSSDVGVPEVKRQRTFLQRYGFPIVLFALCLALGGYLLASQDKGSDLPVAKEGVEFSLPDMNGDQVSLSGTNGKVRLMYFFFANCPDVCPPTTFVMSQVQDQLIEDSLFGDEVEFLSITVDPENDTPEVLKEYAERFEADTNGWKFLRGDEAEIDKLATDYGNVVFRGEEGISHANLIVLIDRKGRIRNWISGNEFIEDMGEGKASYTEITAKIKSLL